MRSNSAQKPLNDYSRFIACLFWGLSRLRTASLSRAMIKSATFLTLNWVNSQTWKLGTSVSNSVKLVRPVYQATNYLIFPLENIVSQTVKWALGNNTFLFSNPYLLTMGSLLIVYYFLNKQPQNELEYRILKDTKNKGVSSSWEWFSLAEHYINEKQDIRCAEFCYKKVLEIDSKHVAAYFMLGRIYQNLHESHLTFTKQLFRKAFYTSKEFYQKAWSLLHKETRARSFVLDSSDQKMATAYFKLGEDNYYAKSGHQKDRSLAHACYQQVIQLNPNHSSSLYRLGQLYEHGEGVDANLSNAKSYYNRASKLKHYKASIQLVKLLHFRSKKFRSKKEIVSNLYMFGERYFNGENGCEKDYFLSYICFRKIVKENPKHPDSLFMLGILYQNGGYGVNNDTEKAKSYFRRAARHNHKKAKVCFLLLENSERKNG